MSAEVAFRAYIEAFNRGDVDAIVARYAPTTSFVNPFNPRPMTTRDEIRSFVAPMFAAYRELTATIDDVVADGGRLAARLRIQAVHTGPLPTPTGTVAPTGRRVDLRTAEFVRLGDDNLIVEHERIFDRAALLAQLDGS